MNPFTLTSLIRPESLIAVVDIGASLVETPPYQQLLSSGVARVIGFEPNPDECEKLRRKYEGTHEFYPYFIGDGNPAIFRETNWFATGSLFRPNKALIDKYQNLHEVTTLVAEHPVQTKALDDIPEIADIDYIKIDVQGSELSVFRNADRLLSGVTLIHTEVCFVELYEHQPLFADVDMFLRSKGFQFIKFTTFGTRCLKPLVMDNNINTGNQQLWSDAIYLRDLSHAESMPTEKLVKLAIVCHDVYGFYDFSLYLLNLLDSRQGTDVGKRYLELLLAN